ncbi:MAG: hypothetical protein GKR96_12335 [Gammaproteobacteria bacterium]|nr:hypothetical protein [Gammaproteobacteria bacterium]
MKNRNLEEDQHYSQSMISKKEQLDHLVKQHQNNTEAEDMTVASSDILHQR